jgi:hypothetical protein
MGSNHSSEPTLTLQVAFYRGPNNWRTWIVQRWTGSIYTHAELVLPSGESLGICPDTTGRISMYERDYEEDCWDFINLAVDREQLLKIVNFFIQTHGDKYDWTGMILSHLTPFYIKHDRKWYCSQWIACALTSSDVFSFMYNKINPGKLYDILSVKINNGLIRGAVE